MKTLISMIKQLWDDFTQYKPTEFPDWTLKESWIDIARKDMLSCEFCLFQLLTDKHIMRNIDREEVNDIITELRILKERIKEL